jgi:RNA-binding protein
MDTERKIIVLTSKQRSYLRGLSNTVDAIFQVGKSGVTPEITNAVDDALEARELVKISVLNNCMMDSREVADILHERTRSDVVQVIGKKLVLYRTSKENKKIQLPK